MPKRIKQYGSGREGGGRDAEEGHARVAARVKWRGAEGGEEGPSEWQPEKRERDGGMWTE